MFELVVIAQVTLVARAFTNIFRFPVRTFLQNITAPSLERRIMKKLNKVASLLAAAALVTSMSFGALAQPAQSTDNWVNGNGNLPWKNGTNELCWRDGVWTPATAQGDCDGAVKKEEPAPAPVAPPPAPAPAASAAPVAPVKAAPVSEKVTFAADAFFDTGKYKLKPEGKAKLDDLASKVGSINLEVIIAVGHTDSVGSDKSNQKLSVNRAEAVKAYLVSKGVEKNRVYTEGKGEKQPVADNKNSAGRAKNRRVEIEVVGTKK
jgi:OmpA-OmpF porin, OOP family